MDKQTVSIQPRLLCSVLSITAILLVGISFLLQVMKFHYGYNIRKYQMFLDVSLEQNLPTFFSTLLMFIICVYLLFIALLKRKTADRYTTKWFVLCLGFFYMSFDEGFHVHEALVGIIRPMLWDGQLGIFYYAWVIPGIFMVLLLFIYFFSLLQSLPETTKWLFVISAAVYLSGAIGMELIGGYYDELHGWNNLLYNTLSTVEEGLEMAGLILYVYALLHYQRNTIGIIQVGVAKTSQ